MAKKNQTAPKAPVTPPEVTEEKLVMDTRTFPGFLLAYGGKARRRGWAPGFELVALTTNPRTGGHSRIMTTGSRAGLVPWEPRNLSDELLADDWELSILPSQLTAVEEAIFGGLATLAAAPVDPTDKDAPVIPASETAPVDPAPSDPPADPAPADAPTDPALEGAPVDPAPDA